MTEHDDLSGADSFRLRAERAARARIPAEFRDAAITEADIAAWSKRLVAAYWPPEDGHYNRPTLREEPLEVVPSLLITGPPGVGKTYQAFGAILKIMRSTLPFTWYAVRAANLYARLRPRPDADSQAEFERYATAHLLLLDDLGATKDSPWTEETLDRLVDWRWSWHLPTIYTTNLPTSDDNGPSLQSELSARVVSRLKACVVVPMKGTDRRRPPGSGDAMS